MLCFVLAILHLSMLSNSCLYYELTKSCPKNSCIKIYIMFLDTEIVNKNIFLHLLFTSPYKYFNKQPKYAKPIYCNGPNNRYRQPVRRRIRCLWEKSMNECEFLLCCHLVSGCIWSHGRSAWRIGVRVGALPRALGRPASRTTALIIRSDETDRRGGHCGGHNRI